VCTDRLPTIYYKGSQGTRTRGGRLVGGRVLAISHCVTHPTIYHITPQFSQVLVSPSKPIDIRHTNYLHLVVAIPLQGRYIRYIGSAVANPLKSRLSTKLSNHVADQVHRCLCSQPRQWQGELKKYRRR